MEWEQNRAAQRNQPHNGSSAPQPLFPTIRRTPFQNRRSSKRRTVKGKSCVMCFKVMIPQGTITESCQYIVVMHGIDQCHEYCYGCDGHGHGFGCSLGPGSEFG